jgi:hypothetical protein
MAIPIGILIVRRLEQRKPETSNWLRLTAVPLVFVVSLSLIVTRADSKQADAARAGAIKILEKYPPVGKIVWYQGHWGFQYYMDLLGARAMDITKPPAFTVKDVLVLPTTNTNVSKQIPYWAQIREVISVPSSHWLATTGNGAGFYSDRIGPLPFAFGSVPPERFSIIGVGTNFLAK